MVESHRETLSIILTLIIVFMAGFVIHVFLPSLIWAVIISIATYPLYRRWRRLLGKQSSIASLFFTFFIAIAIILPIYWLLTVLVQETQIFINHLMWLNHHGQAVPSPLANLPFIGDEISRYWQKHFSKPGGLKPWLSSLHLRLTQYIGKGDLWVEI
jgi:predicted PurR-regulated permease PerM